MDVPDVIMVRSALSFWRGLVVVRSPCVRMVQEYDAALLHGASLERPHHIFARIQSKKTLSSTVIQEATSLQATIILGAQK